MPPSRPFLRPTLLSTRLQSPVRRSSSPASPASQPRPLQCKLAAQNGVVPASAHCRLYDIRDQLVPYHTAWEWQHAIVDQMKANHDQTDALILLEHEPVYTLGTASNLQHVLFQGEALRRGQHDDTASTQQTPLLVRTERGGEVTYHGPGQLVAYPILNLTRHKKDLHWYLRSLEDVVINMLHDYYALHACRKDGLTGVWVGDEKVCALGLKVSKWITMHGLAINVTADLSAFERINPCGITDFRVTSLQQLVGSQQSVDMTSARDNFIAAFTDKFGPYAMRSERLN